MIFLFDKNEELLTTFDNANKEACPYYRAHIVEELNGPFTLELEIPADHEAAKELIEDRMVVLQDRNKKWQAFYVRELEEEHARQWTKRAYCEHIIIELDDEVVDLAIDRKSTALALGQILNGTRWEIGSTDDTAPHTFNGKGVNALDALNTFANRWEIELEYRIELSGQKIIHRYIDARAQRGEVTGKRFEYNKDMESIRRTVDTSGIKTALIGYGNEQDDGTLLTFTDINGGANYVEDADALTLYGRINEDGSFRHRFGVFELNTDDADELLQKTREALEKVKYPLTEYEAKVIDISRIAGLTHEEVQIGATCGVIDRELDLELSARVIKLEYDLVDEEEASVTLGNFMPIQSMTIEERIKQVESDLGSVDVELPEDLVREGDAINTDWLEGEISALRNKILAGAGTVQITENDGILIVDDPDNPTQALRLLGGMLALANEKSPTTGLWNWRSFGTAEGWLGDLVQTGFIRFDRSKGGILELGGEDDQNGVFIVRNERGENIAELNGNYGGFGELAIDELKSTQNVVFSTYNNTPNLEEDGTIKFYVAPYEGDDQNDGTYNYPLASVQAAIDRLPKYLNHNVYILYVPTLLNDTQIRINGFYGSGVLYLQRWKTDVRYVKDFLQGSDANEGSHWVEMNGEWKTGGTHTFKELSHIKDGMNAVSGSGDYRDPQQVVDGDTQSGNYYESRGDDITDEPKWVMAYTGGAYDDSFEHIRVWHYWSDGRTYNSTKTQVGPSGHELYTVFDSEREGKYKETSEGHYINVNKAYLKGDIHFRNNMCRIDVRELFIDAGDYNGIPARAYYNKYINFTNVVVFGGDNTNYLFFFVGSDGMISTSEANNATQAAVYCEQGNLYVYSLKGSNVSYAFRAHGAGLIAGSYHAPYASADIVWESNGGTISGSWTKTTGDFSPITIVEKRQTWTNTTAANWQENYSNYSDTKDPRQGKWDQWGPNRGLWFFGSDMRNTVSASNVTIKRIRVYVTRANNSGYSSAVPIYIMPHGYPSRPSYAPSLFTSNVVTKDMARGDSAWIDVTSKFKSLFESGDAYGIGIYTSNTSNSLYARMTQTAKIEVTYETTV